MSASQLHSVCLWLQTSLEMGHYTSTLLVTLVCARLMTTTRLEPSGPPRLVSSHLLTVWTSQTEISPGLCRQLQVILVERSWRGDVVRTDCGLAGYDQCQLSSQLGLSLSLDIRQCRLTQFRSPVQCRTCQTNPRQKLCSTYKLCLDPGGSQCSQSFSLEGHQQSQGGS